MRPDAADSDEIALGAGTVDQSEDRRGIALQQSGCHNRHTGDGCVPVRAPASDGNENRKRPALDVRRKQVNAVGVLAVPHNGHTLAVFELTDRNHQLRTRRLTHRSRIGQFPGYPRVRQSVNRSRTACAQRVTVRRS